VTPQSDVFVAIRAVAADANKYSAEWLWECFEKTGKNSPAHLACMTELYGLLCQGIGAEHAGKFLDVARATPDKEATVTRLYAMDAASLLLEKESLECDMKGNYFVTRIGEDVKKAARETLEALAKDPEGDVRTRAERLLAAPKKDGGAAGTEETGETEEAKVERTPAKDTSANKPETKSVGGNTGESEKRSTAKPPAEASGATSQLIVGLVAAVGAVGLFILWMRLRRKSVKAAE
jgi:hypothetical protein